MIKLVRIGVLLIITVILLISYIPASAANPRNSPEFATDHILVKFKSGVTAAAVQSTYKRHGSTILKEIPRLGIQMVTVPDGTVQQQIQAYRSDSTVEYAEPDYTVRAIGTPNDPGFANQWGLTKIQAPEAWDVTTGNSDIKIAILDTGIDQDHEDLAEKIVANQNFSTSSTVDDLYGHGTHVAGIAAAITNNGTGVAGVAYNASLMNVKVMDDTGNGTDSSVASGITWAADNGAKVINLSLGGPDLSSTLEDAVNYAWSKGVVVVASAGNNGDSTLNYPAAYSNCISVAATDDTDAKASFSTYGTWVDVAAPGVNIYSTLPNHSNYLQKNYGYPLNYGYLDGTSMAAPFVSGLAALVWSSSFGTDNSAVRNQIESGADPIPGTGTYWQYGRINALRAVEGGVPIIETDQATNVTSISATLNGNLISMDTARSVQVSFEYGTTQSYGLSTTPQTMTTTGTFSSEIIGLIPDKTYYFRAKAVGNGTAYGGENIFYTWVTSPGGKIAFFSAVGNKDGIFLMNPDGTNQTLLLSVPGRNLIDPKWSPDGKKLAYTNEYSDSSTEDENIWVVNADGTNNIQLTDNSCVDKQPAWSPDGTKIAFASGWTLDRPTTNNDIWIMNSDGSNQVRLTNGAADEEWPTWSPDGKKIAYMARPDGSIYSQIFIMNSDGSNVIQLTNGNYDHWWPSWSPDGFRRIAFIADPVNYINQVYLINIDGSNQTQLTFNSYESRTPSWSPDGSKIVFSAAPSSYHRVFVMNPDGSNQVQLTTIPGYEPDWAPGSSAAPEVTTDAASNISSTSVTLSGNLSSKGTASSVDVSFQWGISPGNYHNETPPQTMANTGTFNSNLDNLSPDTFYYYRAKATGDGTAYGEEKSFTTLLIPATITLGNLNQTYDGSPKSVTYTTRPQGLTASITYNGSANPPTDAGSYDVIAAITSPGYSGSTQGTLTIAKVTPVFSNLSSPTILVSNTSTSLGGNINSGALIPTGNVAITLNGKTQQAAITRAGHFSSSFSTGNLTIGVYPLNYNYSGDINFNILTDNSKILTVNNTSATITLGNLNQIYDGSPKSATYSTDPPNLTVSITYDGSPTPPTNAGSYDVIATVTDPAYSGSAQGTLVIAKADPVITWNNPPDITFGTPLSAVQLNATADIPGAFTYSPPVGTVLDAGSGQRLGVTFTPEDSANYNTATKSVTITVIAPPINHPVSGGGGGGWAPPPSVIKPITLSGLNSTIDLKLDASGYAQAATQLKTDDGKATLDISKNTRLLDSNGKTLETFSAFFLTSPPVPPPQNTIVTAYEFCPDGAQFNPPLTLTLNYDPNSLPTNVDGKKITLAFWNGSQWETVESTLNTETNTVTAKIGHFSEYALLAELAPAKFTLSDLQITEDKFDADRPVTIQTLVTNTGGSQGKYTAYLTLNSFGVNKREVTLAPGKSDTVSFVLKDLIPAEYIVAINDKTGQFTVAEPSPVIVETPQTLEPEMALPTSAIINTPTSIAPTPSPEKKTTNPVIWSMIGAVMLLALITGVLINRRKEKH